MSALQGDLRVIFNDFKEAVAAVVALFTPPSMFTREVKPEVTFYSRMQVVHKEFWERPFGADGRLMVWS